MALRQFLPQEAKRTASDISSKADEVKSILNQLSSLLEENVGNKNVWTGMRAEDFLSKYKEEEAGFNKFIEVIRKYPEQIDESYKRHQEFENSGK